MEAAAVPTYGFPLSGIKMVLGGMRCPDSRLSWRALNEFSAGVGHSLDGR